MDTTQGYTLTRIDGLKDMLTRQEKLLEQIIAGQKELTEAVKKIGTGPGWVRKIPVNKRVIKNGATLIMGGSMLLQGTDVMTVLGAISKMWH